MALLTAHPHAGHPHTAARRPWRRASPLRHASAVVSAGPAPGAAQRAPLGAPATELLRVPACKGLAVRVAKGQLIKVVNTFGAQVRPRRRRHNTHNDRPVVVLWPFDLSVGESRL